MYPISCISDFEVLYTCKHLKKFSSNHAIKNRYRKSKVLALWTSSSTVPNPKRLSSESYRVAARCYCDDIDSIINDKQHGCITRLKLAATNSSQLYSYRIIVLIKYPLKWLYTVWMDTIFIPHTGCEQKNQFGHIIPLVYIKKIFMMKIKKRNPWQLGWKDYNCMHHKTIR